MAEHGRAVDAGGARPRALPRQTAAPERDADRLRAAGALVPESSPAVDPRALLALQRVAGNAAVGSLLHRPPDDPAGATRAEASELPPWRASSDLWYFDGARSDGPSPTEVMLRAEGPSAATPFHWSVVEGADRVELPGGDGAQAVTSEGQVPLRSRGASAGADDVRVRVSRAEGADGVRTYEGSLGVRTPVGVRAISSNTQAAPAAYPVASEQGDGADVDAGDGSAGNDVSAAADQDQSQEPSAGPAPPAAPASLNRKSTNHAASASWGYETRVSYEVLDDKGKVMKGYDVNEMWASGVVNDDPSNDWRRGPAGAFHNAGTTFDDLIGGESPGHTPAPTAPLSPLGSHKVSHWTQEWYVGSLTPGSGTKVQTDTLQKYLDHGAHE